MKRPLTKELMINLLKVCMNPEDLPSVPTDEEEEEDEDEREEKQAEVS